MKRHKRIALELFGPSLLAFGISLLEVAIHFLFEGIHAGGWNIQSFAGMIMFLLCFYLVAGIPSVLYMVAMEWSFAKGLHPASWKTVGYSTLFGFFSGMLIVGVISGLGWDLMVWAHLSGMGAIVGLLLGLLIKRFSREANFNVPV